MSSARSHERGGSLSTAAAFRAWNFTTTRRKVARSRSLLLVIKWILNLRIRRDAPRWGHQSFEYRVQIACKWQKKKNWAVRIEVSAENLSFPFVHSDCRVNAMPFDEYTRHHLTRQPLFTRAVVHRVYDDRHLCATHPDEHLFSFDKNAVTQTNLEPRQ